MFNVISSHSTSLLLCFSRTFHLSEASPVLTNWSGGAGFKTLCGSVLAESLRMHVDTFINVFHVSCPCYLVSDFMNG